jgi:hypothetical protein
MADDVEHEPRTIVIKSSLGASEYIAFTQLAESRGLSQSALVRMLVKEAVGRECSEQQQRSIDPELAEFGTWSFKIGDR